MPVSDPRGGRAVVAGVVTAFVVAGLLYLATALVRPLQAYVARIPAALASAMLAGVLLTLCVAPFRALVADPLTIAPVPAISAALAAGPEAGPDPARRWPAGVACGVTYVVLAPLSVLLAAVAEAAPAGLVATVAGVALIGTFALSASAAFADPSTREAAGVTFLVAASGFTALGVSPAFWALVLGGLVLLVTRGHRRRSAPEAAD